MMERLVDEPRDEATRLLRIEGKPIGQDHTFVRADERRDPPFVAPESHRPHRGLLDESLTRRELEERELRMVDRHHAEEEDAAPEQRLSRPPGNVRDAAHPGWHRHPE